MPPAPAPFARRVVAIIRQDLEGFDVRRIAATRLARVIPHFRGNRLRSAVLRTAGWEIGAGTTLFGVPRVFGVGLTRGRLRIGAMSAVSLDCTFELSDLVDIGDYVSLGPNVTVLTSSHRLGPATRRAGELYLAPVVIEDGAWIGAHSVVLPGVTIGAGAVVAANSVVNKDVAANTLVAGVPAAVVVKRLPR